MLEYKSKYKKKSLSIFGEPQISIFNNFIKNGYINKNSKILIPNCLDGLYVLYLTTHGYKSITCYEESKILLYGGVYDNFYTTGLLNRLDQIHKKVNLKRINYYSAQETNKYDLVFAEGTLQLKENDNYSLEEKISKLKDSVNDNGFLYIKYYIGKDNEVSFNQTINKNQMLNLFEKKQWNIVHYREYNKPIKHHKHPNNRKEHTHIIGHVLFQKKPYIYKKRNFNRTYKKVSVFGNIKKRVYYYIDFLKNNYQKKPDVLIVDANDGRNVIPFAKNDCNVTCYEDNSILLKGGIFEGKETNGLIKRLKDQELLGKVIIKESNYYKFKDIKKYDFIYIDDSLHYKKYEDISMKKKVRKLMSNVREGGYLYIHYVLKKNKNDNINSYLELNEILSYFDLKDWRIVYIFESTKKSIYSYDRDNSYNTGYILANKIRNRRVYVNHYEIEINNEF